MPFSEAQFFEVFRQYNEAIWPIQAVLFLVGIVAVIAILRGRRGAAVIVAALWAWCGIEYHWLHFAAVNKAAWLFGLLFLAAAALVLKHAGSLRSDDVPKLRRSIGLAFVVYALVVYPAAGYLGGHLYPSSPTFGAPCPLTIFTLGLFLMTARPLPAAAVAIPLLWSFIGSTAIFSFGMLEDLGMTIAGATLVTFLIHERLAPVRPAPA